MNIHFKIIGTSVVDGREWVSAKVIPDIDDTVIVSVNHVQELCQVVHRTINYNSALLYVVKISEDAIINRIQNQLSQVSYD